MPVADDRYSESSTLDRLLELVRKTKRYSICEVEQGRFEVIDNRCLLDHLLLFPELRPTTIDLLEIGFNDFSDGPTLSEDDHRMLWWLEETVEMLDPKGENTAYTTAYDDAYVLRGTFEEVEYFMLAALNHRVQ
jgi:hypothetical protein